MWIKHFYVTVMLQIISRALCALSLRDQEAAAECRQLPTNLLIEMAVMGTGQRMLLLTTANHKLQRVKPSAAKEVDLSLNFKHLEHAFMVFSFQDNAAGAFTRDRIIADGELSYAICLVRILNRMQSIILPKFIAVKAVKRYPKNLSFITKISTAAKVYSTMAVQLLLGK